MMSPFCNNCHTLPPVFQWCEACLGVKIVERGDHWAGRGVEALNRIALYNSEKRTSERAMQAIRDVHDILRGDVRLGVGALLAPLESTISEFPVLATTIGNALVWRGVSHFDGDWKVISHSGGYVAFTTSFVFWRTRFAIKLTTGEMRPL